MRVDPKPHSPPPKRPDTNHTPTPITKTHTRSHTPTRRRRSSAGSSGTCASSRRTSRPSAPISCGAAPWCVRVCDFLLASVCFVCFVFVCFVFLYVMHPHPYPNKTQPPSLSTTPLTTNRCKASTRRRRWSGSSASRRSTGSGSARTTSTRHVAYCVYVYACMG